MEAYEETRKQFVTVILKMSCPAEVEKVKVALQQYAGRYGLASGDSLRRTGEILQRIFDCYGERELDE